MMSAIAGPDRDDLRRQASREHLVTILSEVSDDGSKAASGPQPQPPAIPDAPPDPPSLATPTAHLDHLNAEQIKPREQPLQRGLVGKRAGQYCLDLGLSGTDVLVVRQGFRRDSPGHANLVETVCHEEPLTLRDPPLGISIARNRPPAPPSQRMK